MTLYDETDRRWDLAARIGVGGEGEVFRLEGAPMHCAKVYLQRPVPETKVRKLEALRARAAGLQGVAALPLSLLYAKPGRKQAAGVVLPFVEGRDIHELYNPEARQEAFPGADLGFLVAVARNVAFVFGRVHAAGMVIGDVSEQNLKVRGDATGTLPVRGSAGAGGGPQSGGGCGPVRLCVRSAAGQAPAFAATPCDPVFGVSGGDPGAFPACFPEGL